MTIPFLTDAKALPDWARRVVLAINIITSGYPFKIVATLPAIADVADGYTVFDQTTGKVQTASGGSWWAHW